MSEHPNVGVLRRGYQAIAAGDLSGALALFTEDAVMHIRANGPLGGDHAGRDAIGRALAGLVEWTGGTVLLDVEEIFADDEHALAVIRETATRASDALALDVREIHLYRIVDGLAAEFWDLPADRDREAHESFFS
jgi:ketosteroid isomerase-like protein